MTENPFAASDNAPESQTLPDLLIAQARSRPNAVAVVEGDAELTFRDLIDRAQELGRYLRHLGVGPDQCIGLFVDPSLDLMIGAWGILFAGAGYLPLSPEYPVNRVRFMIQQSGTRLIVCGESLRAKVAALAPAEVRVITAGDAAAYAMAHPATSGIRPEVGPLPQHMAYIIYTSGSTGDPKGVVIEHHSILNQMGWLQEAYGIGQSTVILQKTPMSFDAAQWEILAVACGSKVVMGPPGVYRDPVRLIGSIVRHQVTALQCVPTLLQALVDSQEFHRCQSLTQVFSGGEALTRRLANQILAVLPKRQVVNLYGPTECTINSSAFTVDPVTAATGPTTISIGSPVHNTQYYVLDGSRQPVEVGETGELYIGGDQLARGYLHRPDLTAERFIDDPFRPGPERRRLYRTGDMVFWNVDGTLQFAGRADNQIKLRGHRIELDEVRLRIEQHHWVKNAAVVVKKDERTGCQNLIALVELNSGEATLMDQGNHDAHHQSKRGKAQVRAQLANPGCRDTPELADRAVLELPGKIPTAQQERRVFERKTYRFYDGDSVRRADILRLLAPPPAHATSRGLDQLCLNEFGAMLRYFGQFHSGERLLPKYGYASPGALYATQMYLELDGFGGLTPGFYYYHPVHHHLVLIRKKASGGAGRQVRVHFVGKKRAIEPIYKLNIREVLEIEAGHIVGLFEVILPDYGLGIRVAGYEPAAKAHLDCAIEDYYLGTFEIVPHAGRAADEQRIDVYVQAHTRKIEDLPAGLYQYTDGALEWVSDEVVLKKQVIAINQQVYERSSFGITLVSRTGNDWLAYIELGRKLHLLQMNDVGLGFMSSGYSSKTGHDLPSAMRMEVILGSLDLTTGASYFFVGGRISDEQRASRGMMEDAPHMKGPAEMIKEDLAGSLPAYMVPARVVVLNSLPQTVNGKIDSMALQEFSFELTDRPFVAPRTQIEERLCELWGAVLKVKLVSVEDDFFEAGGDSLMAVALAHRISQAFDRPLPLQAVFDSPTVEKLAALVAATSDGPCSRLVRLQPAGSKPTIYCWPGLGGYPMNLRLLAARLNSDRPFVGVQAYGINPGEVPYDTLQEMAAADVQLIREQQPTGPYTLFGYSFGARIAFEAAYQIEQAGEVVDQVVLIAPGTPQVPNAAAVPATRPSYTDGEYLRILLSVFTKTIASGPVLSKCLRTVTNEDTFVRFISELTHVHEAMVRRITRLVAKTYALWPTTPRLLAAPVTVFRAVGDSDSFIEEADSAVATVITLDVDHYGLLQEPGVNELALSIAKCQRQTFASCASSRLITGTPPLRSNVSRSNSLCLKDEP